MQRDVMDSARAVSATYMENEKQQAQLFLSQKNPFTVQKLTIALDTARDPNNPYVVNLPHKSFYVQDATDVNVTIDVQLQSQDQINSPFTVRKNDVLTYEQLMPKVNFSWSAQAGKTITIVFFSDAEFKSGSQISVTGGGVVVNEGTSFTDAKQTLAAATAAIVFASDSTRALGVIQNISGASIWVGSSTVTNTGATIGFEVPINGIFEWRNTAALYAYSVAGGDIFKRGQL